MRYLYLTVLLLGLTFGWTTKSDIAPVKSSPIEKQHATAHRIRLVSVVNSMDGLGPNSHCSATAVGSNALLTAAHCVTNTNLLYVDAEKTPTTIVAEIPDGADHIIYLVDRTFSDFAPIAERPLVAQEPVHFWGNPGHSHDVFREGFYVDMQFVEELHYTCEHFTLATFGGDSGSGLMDANGNVVAVLSLGNTSAEELSFPLAFTAKQLDAAGVKFTLVQPSPPSILNFFLKGTHVR